MYVCIFLLLYIFCLYIDLLNESLYVSTFNFIDDGLCHGSHNMFTELKMQYTYVRRLHVWNIYVYSNYPPIYNRILAFELVNGGLRTSSW